MTDDTSSPSTALVTDLDFPLRIEEAGEGRPALILHGGGGPMTVAVLGAHLCETMHTITPTHPGWNATPRPDSLTSIEDLAQLYLDLLRANRLHDVLIVGSSIGGWIAVQMAALDAESMISQIVLVDSVGIEVENEPIRDFFALDARGVAQYSFHDAERFYVDPAQVGPEQAAVQAANIATMRLIAGDPYMHDPALRQQVGEISIPALVLWGDSDRIVTPAYGRAFAAALGNAVFEVIDDAGHLPQIEQPTQTTRRIDAFLGASQQHGT